MKLEILLDKCFDKRGRLIAGKAQKLIIAQCEDYDNLIGNSFGEKVYLLKNKIQIPKCPTCGKELVHHKGTHYSTYCSEKCRSNNQLWKNNRKGMGFQSKEVQEKSRQTRKKRYGFDWAAQNPDTKKKIKNTLEKKGQEWRNSEEAINLIKKEIVEKGFELLNIFEQNGETYYSIHCKNHNYSWDWTRRGYGIKGEAQHIYCEKCFKERESKEEKEMVAWIKSIYSGAIIENSREIIKPKEIDIFIPEFNLGIEYCGNIWHSSKFLEKNYHLTKLELAEKNEIKLLQIWSSEWFQKQETIKHLIKINLRTVENKVFARKCLVKEIDNTLYRNFCEYNHLQSYGIAKIRLGLFYENNLVQIMSFSKARINKKYEYEMIRECSKLGYQIVGGKSKLLNYFEKKYEPKSIISYCDRRLFSGNSYLQLGFKQLKFSPPNYQYFDGHKLYSRQVFQKHKLKNLLKIYDENLTEKENCQKNNFWQLYDCGNKIFVKNYIV
jgi:endogenous inhibitor of DNA gyrase (YacG/DUF329 family)